MKAVESALFFLSTPRVVHALPGRLRLHAPSLKRLGQGHDDLVSLTARLLATPEDILEVSPCVATGNIVIRYDAECLSQDEVMAFLDAVIKIVIAHRADWLKVRRKNVSALESRLSQWLSESLSQRLHLDHRLRIPADVFQ